MQQRREVATSLRELLHLKAPLSPPTPRPIYEFFPCAQDTGGENPYIDTKDALRLLNWGRHGRHAADHPWSALRRVKAAKRLPNGLCAAPGDDIHNGTSA